MRFDRILLSTLQMALLYCVPANGQDNLFSGKTAELGRQLTISLTAEEDFGHPMIAPPGMRADRVKLLRDAYAKTLKDPALIADIKKQEYDFEPVSSEELQALAKIVVTQPPQMIERLKRISGN